MKRLLIALAALLLVLGMSPLYAHASGDDDDTSGSGSASADSDDGDDDSDSDDDDDDDDDEVDDDDDDEVDDDDDDGHHQRRHRRRHRNRGGDDAPRTGGGTGTTPPRAGTAPSRATVQIADRSFDPSTIRVAVGGSVTWDNISREHTVTADDNSFDSGVIDQGQSFSKTFTSPGEVGYRCLIHPEMTGQVVVGDGAASASSATASSSAPRRSANSSASSSSQVAAVPSSDSSGQPSLSTVPTPAAAAAGPTTVDVDVRDFEFSPADVTIARGGTVRWTLSGTAPHTVTADSFDSGMLRAGDTYEQTFNDVGTVDYRCDLHSEMQGTITVAETAAPAGDAGAATSGGGDRGGGAASAAAPAADTGANGSATGLLAQSGFGGVPALLIALGVILLGWAAVVTGRRRGSRRPV